MIILHAISAFFKTFEPFALKPNFPFGSTAASANVLKQSVKNELTRAGIRQI